ncbi:MAG: PQQ-binding-like beta-propeller repeat protein [Phycisphaerales bacterium]|nr:MAG: PQQ-binding-like beta-propeller repeat protein [Phycisphaerales bacterium]
MSPRTRFIPNTLFLLLVSALISVGGAQPADSGREAAQILDLADVKGGLVVHVGCGDGRLTAALRASDSTIVHGLDRDPANVAMARKHIQSLGQYGDVFVEQWAGERLPYIDNSVNLIVSEDLGGISDAEVMRVLAPNGVVCTKSRRRWTKVVKPRPPQMDEWTHYLHDPTNNAVAHDSLIEPPSRYQWVAGPRYSRQHDHMSSVSAVVSAGGRLFYIFDEAPRASILLPPQWRLIARDAFNGKQLWERPIELWHPHLWRLKSGPQMLARRLVAAGERLYVTLGIDAPLSALDAATGQTIRTYNNTKATEEVLCSDGVLILSVAAEGQPLRSDPAKRYATLNEMNNDVTNPLWTQAPRTIMAVDADSGRVLWQTQSELVSLSLAADSQRVLFHDGRRIRCLDRRSGQPLWASEPLPKKEGMRSSGGATLVLYDDVVLYSGQVPEKPRQSTTTMFALSLKDGRTLWKASHHPCGHMGTPDDILVAGGLVWNGAVAKGTDSGTMTGRDLYTGEVKSEFAPDVETHWFHHRCYRAKATDKYLLFSRTGIEFIDHADEHWICHHWVRGACHYGIMPCNGLIYAPQHPCACYIEAKLYGFTALAPPSPAMQPRRNVPDRERLTRGPAYRQIANLKSQVEDSLDWPTFRHDGQRSGAIKTTVEPSELKRTWGTNLGGKLSAPVLADGKLFVASADVHSVHALDADTGQPEWNFTAAGRIDSPPTIWQGRALFGSADGHVYCLNARDGRLVWRYRAAPEDQRMMAFEQLESLWPVHGSVLVQDDVLYCVAGRSMFVDGGLRLLRLDPKTGRKLSETILDDKDPETQKNLQVRIQTLNMPVALPDILSSDGKYVYMRSLPFTLEGRRKFVAYVPVNEQQGDDLHLFCPTGFLDDSLWHRTYWGYGRAWASGAGGYYRAGRVIPAGRPLVFDDETVYGYGRLWQYYRWSTPLEFSLFAAKKQPEIVKAGSEKKAVKKGGKRVGVKTLPFTRFVQDWSDNVSVQVTSMVLTDNALFAAGPPDVEDEEQAVKTLLDPETQSKLAEQSAAFEGKRGAVLIAVSRDDGAKLAAYRLDFVPRFDGLIAANGRLYVSTLGGEVLCLSGAKGRPLSPADEVVAAASN